MYLNLVHIKDPAGMAPQHAYLVDQDKNPVSLSAKNILWEDDAVSPRMPTVSGSKHLDKLASDYNLDVRVPVQWRSKGPNRCETCEDAKVSVQTVACEGVFAHLAETANTHVRRKLLLDKEVECGVCFESKPFREFLVPECGHAYCKDCYLKWLKTEPKKCCSSGCAAALNRYNTPETHSDFYPLWLRDMPDDEAAATSSADAAAARGSQDVVRTQGAFCFRAV